MRCLVVLAEWIGLMNQEPAGAPREPRTISRTCSGAPAVRTLAARSCACGKLTLARRSRRLETAIAGTDNSSTPKPRARTAQSGSLATPAQTQTLVLVARAEAQIPARSLRSAGVKGSWSSARAPGCRSAALRYCSKLFVPTDTKSTCSVMPSIASAAAGTSWWASRSDSPSAGSGLGSPGGCTGYMSARGNQRVYSNSVERQRDRGRSESDDGLAPSDRADADGVPAWEPP
jgi:hypothetical protein